MAARARPRLPLGVDIQTRDGTLSKDAQMWNCHPVKEGDVLMSERRFGYLTSSIFPSGQALGLFVFLGHTITIISNGDGTASMYKDTSLVSATINGSSRYWFALTGQGATGLFIKNTAKAYTYDGTTLTNVTDVNYPSSTTSSVAVLDATVYVQDQTGRVWNSVLNTPGTWDALGYVAGSLNSDTGVAVCRYLQFVLSLCANSMTLYYDAGNSPGSPLNPQTSVVVNVGCASGDSVVEANNTVFFIGKTRQKGRSVYMMEGSQPAVISTPYVDRVLNNSNLTNIRAFCVSIYGHNFYILNIYDLNLTLVYDMTTSVWGRWSSSSLGNQISFTSYSLSGGTMTIVAPDHGLHTGQIVFVDGTGLSGNVVVSVIDGNTFSFDLLALGIVSGGINSNTIDVVAINNDTDFIISDVVILSITPYTQNVFSPAYYATNGSTDYLLDYSNGLLYTMLENTADDAGMPIYQRIDTMGLDLGTNSWKFFAAADLIADKITDIGFMMYSDNDYVSYGLVKTINLNANRVQTRKLGRARRRSFSVIYIGAYPARFGSLEFDLTAGRQ